MKKKELWTKNEYTSGSTNEEGTISEQKIKSFAFKTIKINETNTNNLGNF